MTRHRNFAFSRSEKDAPGSCDSTSSIAASIGFLLVEMRRVEVGSIHSRVGGVVGWLIASTGGLACANGRKQL
jgi:hypothetical protein